MTHLSIAVLGSLQVSIADTPITTLESARVRALLAFLAIESDRPHRRETLVGLLWPDYPEDAARHNLRQALFNLRLILGDHTASHPYLLVSRDSIQFNRDSDYSLDLDQFNYCFYTCEENLSQCKEDCSIHASRLEEMVKLYRGEFLQQFFLDDSTEFEEWALMQRENVHQRTIEAHSYLANYYELHGDFKNAQRHALRQLELDPWREEAHRQMMRVLALDGQRSAAIVQYETCRQVLAKELDVEPSAETRELYEQIRLGTISPETEQVSQDSSALIHNLPVQLTPFVGREVELAYLGQLISAPECRCITLVGPGGMGKTRLAVQAAETHLSEFTQGGAFVPLASVGSIDEVISAIANAIKFTFFGPSDPKEYLLSYLHEKQMLLVLDNLEHLLIENPLEANIADLLIEILQQAPGIKLLVTSREALNLQEEWLFEVQGLAFPDMAQTEGLDGFDAITLFAQRARRASPKFKLNEDNRKDVAHICRLVEGMPLAIELAATWMRTLSPAEIAVEIGSSLDFLSTTVRDLPERHRSMRVVFDRSWQMLSPEEQQVLCRLSIFQGGFQRHAAEQVAGATLSILSTLMNRTLLRRAAAGRYDLHELVRQYSAAQLASDPQAKRSALEGHYTYYLALAEAAEKELKGRNQLEWLGRLEQEHDNLRAAMDWAFESDEFVCGDGELVLRLAAALRWYWRMRGHFHEGRDRLKAALQCSPESRTAARARALLGKSLLENAIGDLGAARAPAEECLSIFRELGDQECLAEALIVTGINFLWQGEAALGLARTREALEIYQKLGDRWGQAHALYRLGTFLADSSGDQAGRAMLIESTSLLEGLGDKYLYTSVLISLGVVDMSLGNYDDAQPFFERGLVTTREIRHPWGIADALTNLGCLYRIRGEYATAQAHFEEALQVYREQGRNVWETDVLCAMTENDISQGDFTTAQIHVQAAYSRLGASENKWLLVLVCYLQGLLAYYVGDINQAAAVLERATTLAREGQFKPDLARSLMTLGLVRLKLGEVGLATELLKESLSRFRDIGNKLGIAITLEALASVRLIQGNSAGAVKLYSTAYRLREVLGAPLPPIDRSAYDSAIAATLAQLGEPAFMELSAAAEEGSLEEVVEETLKADEVS
jgi:predicted ATPase/DNA-binding SARP family transcriptional activator